MIPPTLRVKRGSMEGDAGCAECRTKPGPWTKSF
jgi:hypothetical protein